MNVASAQPLRGRRDQKRRAEPPQSETMKPSHSRRSFWVLLSLLLFLAVLVVIWEQVVSALDRPVRKVQIDGQTRHLDRQQLARDLADEISHSTLLSLDVVRLQSLTRENPWVRRADITLRWPDLLSVHVEEEVPVARWGEQGLLNQQGEVFLPPLKPEYQQLPLLDGPARETARVMARYHELNPLFRQIGLNIAALRLEARGAWALTLDNGIKVIVGRQAEEERLARFLSIYPAQLAERAAEIEQVDTRYSNGIAVRWRPAPVQNEKQIDDGNGQ
ncbi:MAG: cell division protein FtsQ/DivIB [Marinobacterium sp.]|nr:cell division protein FtsQ/DivIB [Marinobacterium sp.]